MISTLSKKKEKTINDIKVTNHHFILSNREQLCALLEPCSKPLLLTFHFFIRSILISCTCLKQLNRHSLNFFSSNRATLDFVSCTDSKLYPFSLLGTTILTFANQLHVLLSSSCFFIAQHSAAIQHSMTNCQFKKKKIYRPYQPTMPKFLDQTGKQKRSLMLLVLKLTCFS